MNLSDALSENAQVTLLLTSHFGRARGKTEKPLSIREWGKLGLWLKKRGVTPADLLSRNAPELLRDWRDGKVTVDRLRALLDRGHSFALAMEKWQRAGLWVVTRSDPEYPRRLKQRLKADAPPVLFGCGDKELMNAGGIAVVGSRDACEEDLAFARNLGGKAAGQDIGIVSGGARGVDETAMMGAAQLGGRVIGVMADGLMKAATHSKWRKELMEGGLVLISPFYPEAGFMAYNAMARNKYIYCLSDAAVVIHSRTRGGTIGGAEENLKNRWVSLWVKATKDISAANGMLVEKGGHWLADNIDQFDLASLMQPEPLEALRLAGNQPDLFSQHGSKQDVFPEQVSEQDMEKSDSVAADDTSNRSQNGDAVFDESGQTDDGQVDFYQIFTGELQHLAKEPLGLEDLIEKTRLRKSQLADWLKRAVEDGYVRKLNRPVRYQRVMK